MKNMKKQKYQPSIPVNQLFEACEKAPITYVIKGARAMRCSDYAITYYYNKKHPKYYKNPELARRALRRAIDDANKLPVSEFVNPIDKLIESMRSSGYKFKSDRD